ncbi:MAG: glycosyltransferase family 2 protein [Bacteroidales bacterium]|nr:glycosyltransferase family 2 protein [Bacteroidales bacterium]
MMTVAILLAVHNRRDKTLACLESCFSQMEALKADGRFAFSIYLTDDASTDGTSEYVSESFPEVNIIKGDGSLFWNRGMIAAWKEAAENDFDFYLWLNDDIVLCRGAFSTLLENSSYLKHRAVIVGTTVDSEGNISYGGRTRSGKLIPPDKDIPVACDIFNGNIVLVPKYVFEKLGTMDARYSHSFGDYDYGIRALKAGITSVVSPGILAECDRNPSLPKWRDASFSVKERYRSLMSPKGRPFREQFLYDARSSNVFNAVAHFVSLNMKVVFARRKQCENK